MPRKRTSTGTPLSPAQALAAWAKPKSPRKKGAHSKSSWEAAIAEAKGRVKSRDWADVRPMQFVALYAICYEQVYGIAPLLSSTDRMRAASMASRALKSHFDGNEDELVDFVRWAWRREHGREKWRREHGGGKGGKLSWNLLFGSRILDDYRLDMARKAKE